MIACRCIHWLGSVFVSETNWGYSLLRAWQACSRGWHVMLAEYQGLCRINSRSHLTGLQLLIGRGLDLAKKRNHRHSLGSCSPFKNNSNCHFVRWSLQYEEKSLLMHHGVSCCVLPCSRTTVSRAVFCLVRHTLPTGLSPDLQMFLQVLFPPPSSLSHLFYYNTGSFSVRELSPYY